MLCVYVCAFGLQRYDFYMKSEILLTKKLDFIPFSVLFLVTLHPNLNTYDYY